MNLQNKWNNIGDYVLNFRVSTGGVVMFYLKIIEKEEKVEGSEVCATLGLRISVQVRIYQIL
jgi:hypothetical protein